MIVIEPVEPAAARPLIVEYVQSLGVDLEFQHFNDELSSLDRFYEIILGAHVENELAGCVALHRIDDVICEMKRLYIRPSFRRYGLGRKLAERLIAEARSRGYERMRLDTLPSMQNAMQLYESLGFVDIDPYRFNPIEGSRYLELML